jgi:putative ABC transport system permease protein
MTIKNKLGLTLRDVRDGIRTQPSRMGLSFLAIAIGIASLTVLIAVLGGLREKSRRIVKELGVNVVGILQQGKLNQDVQDSLHERHASMLAQNLLDCPLSTIRRFDVPTIGTSKLLSVVATDSSLIHIRQWKLSDGRFIDHWDLENRERKAVVSRFLSRQWNWGVGDLIMLRDTPFEIVGIVEVGGSALETELGDSSLMLGERVVFVPKTVIPSWVIDQENPGQAIDAIFLRVPDSLNFAQVVSTAQSLLSQPDSRVSHLSWVTPESLLQGVKELQKTIQLTVGSIAALCLILGGTTLMSLMIVNVRDRVTEIGLRRALGASQRDVALLFVLEGCLVTGAAAVTGILGTHLFLILRRQAFPVLLKFGLVSIFIPFLVAMLLAMVSSYWPAKSAARITPSEALRNE